MEGVVIEKLELIADNEKGITFQAENRNSDKFLIIRRKAGTFSGGHYHEGKIPEKDPETIIFLEGTADFILRNIKTNEELTVELSEPHIIKIKPFIYHAIKAKTDVLFLDMNSIEADGDTIRI